MREIVEILMRRDGMSKSEAVAAVKEFQITLNQALEEGWSLCEVEEAFQSDFGLEPDYLMSILPI